MDTNKKTRLAIDIMGGDAAPKEELGGVRLALEAFDDLELTLFGDEEAIRAYGHDVASRVKIVNAPVTVSMGEADPVRYVRLHPEASLCQAFSQTAAGLTDGVVTAGPTQVTIVAAHMILRRMKGMKRLALCPMIPSLGGPAGKSRLLLDCGANVELKPEHYLQFADYATLYAKNVLGRKDPLVGLVNIGSEEHKGREVDRETYALLKSSPRISFYGNIEPKDFWTSPVDILLSDGFTGNIFMKSIEGTAKEVGHFLSREIHASFLAKIGYLFMKKPVFAKLKTSLNSDEVGGAQLFGVNGAVVKAHGAANDYAFFKAIELCKKTVESGIVAAMAERIAAEEGEDA